MCSVNLANAGNNGVIQSHSHTDARAHTRSYTHRPRQVPLTQTYANTHMHIQTYLITS